MKIAVVTGTRAEFGLLRGLMTLIDQSETLELQTIVTGTHLLPEFGLTVQTIREAGISISREVRALSQASTGADVARQVGAGVSEFTDALISLRPDAIVILGDRYEMLAASVAGFFLGIPIVHVHGGEVTHGAFDDTIRHVITKFSSVHCVAHPDYAERVIQLGEQPDSVHVVGSLGIDQLSQTDRLSKEELEMLLEMEIREPFFLVTYHPVTSGASDASAEVRELVAALEGIPDATVIFTMPNADPDHEVIADFLRKSAKRHPGAWLFTESLGQKNYWSLMAIATAVVGNSSSGILEAPSFPVATINIGTRQGGRILARSVISCEPSRDSITDALARVMSVGFTESLKGIDNPLGGPGASTKVLRVLENLSPGTLGVKIFFDLHNSDAKDSRAS